MNVTRQTVLAKIAVGDLFNADTEFGGTVICLALSVTATSILAKDICRGGELAFSRATGVAAWPYDEGRTASTITSVARLPSPIHDTLVRYHRRSSGRVRSLAGPRLTEPEKTALLYVHGYYLANRLPAVGKWRAARLPRRIGLHRPRPRLPSALPDVCDECGRDL